MWKDASEDLKKSHVNKDVGEWQNTIQNAQKEDASSEIIVTGENLENNPAKNLKSQSDSKVITKKIEYSNYIDNSEDAITSADDVRILDDNVNEEIYDEEDNVHDDNNLHALDVNDHKLQSLSQ